MIKARNNSSVSILITDIALKYCRLDLLVVVDLYWLSASVSSNWFTLLIVTQLSNQVPLSARKSSGIEI